MSFIVMHWIYVAGSFSALYTIGSVLWTIRAERLLRALRAGQRAQAWEYNDLRKELDDMQAFLENGDTLRRIPVARARDTVQ